MVKELAVARFRRMSLGRRIKHVVDSQSAVPVNVQIDVVLARATDTPTLGSPFTCETGSKIYGFFITIEAVASESSTTATPNLYFIIYKNPGGNISGFPNGNAVGISDKKNLVFHQEMVMLNAVDGGSPRNIFKGVIAVPKHMQRMAPEDDFIMQLFIPSTGVAVNACTQSHYKEFR